MKRIFNIILLISIVSNAAAQNIDDVLKSIESNNSDIKAAKALLDAQIMETRSQNMLGNTSVAYEGMLGTITQPEKTGKITVTQELEFPSIYAVRGNMNKKKIKQYGYAYEETRRSVLLTAKELYLDLANLNRQHGLIKERLANIRKMTELYDKKFKAGDANALDLNKIRMQEMSENAALTMNINERDKIINQLTALNGGQEIQDLTGSENPLTELPDFQEFYAEAIEADAGIKQSEEAYNVAIGEHKVARNSWLPSLELSYIREMRPAETSNGFEIGVSIPLWNNLRKVKQTKAYKSYAMWQLEKVTTEKGSEIRTDYKEAEKLWETLKDYDINLVYDNISLLDKALAEGQISMIDYFNEINSLYSTIETYNSLKTGYDKAVARMYRFRL